MPPRIDAAEPEYQVTFIRKWRKHRGLSQDRLVERVRERVEGFSKSSLSRIENGLQPYSQPILEALAYSLQCEPADLIMRDPKNPVWSIWDTLRRLEPDDREQVAKIVETFRKAS